MSKAAPLRLTSAMFEILLSLGGEALHGYAIMKEIEERTGGEVALGPTTLYRSLKELLRHGYIEEGEKTDDPDADSRRRTYRLTQSGREAAARRAAALASSLEAARRMGLRPQEGAP